MYLGEFVDDYEMALKGQYELLVMQILAIEAGVGRALSAVLAGKKPRELPTWENIKERSVEDVADDDIWWEQGVK